MAKLDGQFPSTRWTLVLADNAASSERDATVAELLKVYWRPLYVFLRKTGTPADKAEDLLQSFCVHVIETQLFTKASPERGRLRSFLRTALKNFSLHAREAERAQKRGGSFRIVSLEVEGLERELEGTDSRSEIDSFDRQWAVTVFASALARLREEHQREQRAGPFEVLERYFSGRALPKYAELSEEFGISTAQLKSMIHRGRARFRTLIKEQVADTIGPDEDIEAEMGALLQILSASA